jgi:hypothetical protein
MLPTNAILVESSLHGRQRRCQRDITKRDLQAAVKYGIKERGHPCPKTREPRWKYTYADIVYITDSTSTKEVISWALEIPMTREAISDDYRYRLDEAKRRIAQNPLIITSHTVLVVDMSRSMAKSDMNGHRTRSRGVYYEIAEELLAAVLPRPGSGVFSGGSTSFTDVATLIEMRDGSNIIFECEPVSWVLYNSLVDCAEGKGTRGHGNYYFSLQSAFAFLNKYDHPHCSPCLFFFSDGRPSDFCTGYHCNFPSCLYQLISNSVSRFGNRLTFSAFGYGTDSSEFDIMTQMVETAKQAGAKAQFAISLGNHNALRTMLMETRSSLISSRAMLTRLDGTKELEERKVNVEEAVHDSDFDFNVGNWKFFNSASNPRLTTVRLELEWVECEGGRGYMTSFKEVPFTNADSRGFAVSKKIFGQGAERVVWHMTEIDQLNQPVGNRLVAKGNKWERDATSFDKLRGWHKMFIKIQMKAAKLAEKFNRRLDNLGISKNAPRIYFLPSFVYEYHDLENESKFAYLAEAELNQKNYFKWNNNAGGVDGVIRRNVIDYEPQILDQTLPRVIEEEEDENEEDYEDEHPPDEAESKSPLVLALERSILEPDIPQAFSHFTHCYTRRDELVCDLQGELTMFHGNLAFLLTDPCIHRCGRRKYGRTDMGRKGVGDFFATHQCNPVCKLLGIDNGSYGK